MVCLLVLNSEKLLHIPLTASLQMPLLLPLHLPLHVFVFGAFSCLCAFCVDSPNAETFCSVGLELDSSGKFKALIPFFKSLLVQ